MTSEPLIPDADRLPHHGHSLAAIASELLDMALRALSNPGVTHLVVRRAPNLLPEGVISDFDLAALASP